MARRLGGAIRSGANSAAFPEHEKAAHAALLDLGWSFSPRMEDTSADTIVIDLAGLPSLFGAEENIASQLMRRVSALGLFSHVADC